MRAHRPHLVAAVGGLLLSAALSGCEGSQGAGVGLGPGSPTEELTIFVFREGGQPRLHPVQVQVGGDADVNDALFALVTYEPDRGFGTLWNGVCVLGKNPGADAVDVTEDLITVHLNDQAGALCDLDQQGVDLRAQQLAWTVRTVSGSNAPVAVTVGEDNLRVQGPVVADEKYIAPRVLRELQRGGTSPR